MSRLLPAELLQEEQGQDEPERELDAHREDGDETVRHIAAQKAPPDIASQ